LEPNSKQIFTFDHLKVQITDITHANDSVFDRDVEQWRIAFQTHAVKYVEDFFQEAGCCAVYSAKNGNQHVLHFIVTSAIFNPDNFWNGRWRSTWKISFSPGGQATIDGNIKLNIHYYEEGNVQLVSNTEKRHNVNAPNPEQFGKDAVAAIQKIEGDFHNSLDGNYDAMSSTTFKALRRPLPIFKQLIKWENLAQYEVGSNLKS